MNYTPLDLVRWLINLFVWLAVALLGLRVILRLFAANPSSEFVNWVYQTSDTLLAPFRGIFPPVEIEPGHVLDFTALFAMMIYGLLGFLLVYVLGLLTPSEPPTRVVRR